MLTKVACYEIRNGWLKKDTSDPEDEQPKFHSLCNFAAEIVRETRYVDEQSEDVVYTIKGTINGKSQRDVVVPAADFASLGWVSKAWGAKAIICEGSNIKDSIRVAIQMMSDDIEEKTIFRATGWHEVDGRMIYLHSGGAITEEGNDPSYEVELPTDLSKYSLVADDVDPQEAFDSFTSLLCVAPIRLTGPMLAATVRAAFGPADFGLHTTGRSGSFKSELASLFQSAYGRKMDARELPMSWSSTGNALEALAYRTKDALYTIDDYIPVGSTYDIRAFAKKADQIVRGQGNRSGRQRLFDTSKLQSTMYPRGLLLSTGEDTPPGISLRGRLLISEMEPGDVDTEILTIAQKRRDHYEAAMAGLIQWIAIDQKGRYDELCEMAEEIRDEHLDVGHSRTPSTVGQLIAASHMLGRYAAEMKLIDDPEPLVNEMIQGIIETASQQELYLGDSDPASLFVNALQSGLASNKFHFKNRAGGEPEHAHRLGWTEFTTNSGEVKLDPRGELIGWIDRHEKTAYIRKTAITTISRLAGGELSLGESTIIKRLKEARLVTKIDTQRGRNTVRITVQGTQQQVVAVDMDAILVVEEGDHTLESVEADLRKAGNSDGIMFADNGAAPEVESGTGAGAEACKKPDPVDGAGGEGF